MKHTAFTRLLVSAACWLASIAGAASPDPAKSKQLVALVQSNADIAERARALQQLALVASPDAVPALVPLLGDEKLGQYARDVLEIMPDARAGDGLREALGQLKGRALAGVVNSLGVRRDVKAVGPLSRLAAEAGSPAAEPAILALGRIGTAEAGAVLERLFAGGAAELRPAAAESLLLVAERHLVEGRRPAAQAIYDAVRASNLPVQLRAPAMRGAILTRGAGGVGLLIEQLRSPDMAMRDVALRTLRELREPQLTPALVGALDALEPGLQAAVIAAFVERGDLAALPTIEERARAGNEDVRVAALQALGKMGRAGSLPILLQAAAAANPAIAGAALISLGEIDTPEANVAIQRALADADRPVRTKLIAVLGERKAEGAIADLMAIAGGADLELGKAAFRALGLLARPGDLPRLIALSVAAQDEGVRTLADRAIVTTSMKVLEPNRRADAVLLAFRQASDAETKAALVRPLSAIVRSMGGSHEVFFALRSALMDRSEAVRSAVVKCLADWPDATPTTTLLDVAQRKDAPATEREVALAGAIRLATNVAAGRERSPLNVLEAFQQANRAVRSRGERLALVSGLGNLRRPEALPILRPYLDDAEVQAEAALAVVQIAPALGGAGKAPELPAMLERIAASDKDEDVRRKAARLAKGAPPAAAAPKGKKAKAAAAANEAQSGSGRLFNGTDLGGWDGDPGVWRVRDGVIVGGSLEGNLRNEFLATTRSYRNFVLRFDYKLVGTDGFVNGGVQFRSIRIAQPPNEMRGYQADIGAGHSGCLYDESRRKTFLARATEEQIKRLEKPGDWNRCEIRCDGARVELTLNGEKTVTFTEPDSSVPADGLVALQIHGNCKAEISFRDLAIEELR